MTHRHLILAAALAASIQAGSTLAQDPGQGVARLKDVKGNVLVGRETGLAAGGEAARLMANSRVITTAGAEVIVVYDDGCEVRLKENQRFEVETGKPCAALIAQSILSPPTQAAGFALGAVLPPLGGVGIGSQLRRDDTPKNPLSPS